MSFERHLPPSDANHPGGGREDDPPASRREWGSRSQGGEGEPPDRGATVDKGSSPWRKKKKKSSLSSGLGCLILFALPFAAAGAFTGYLVVSTVLAHHQMKSWEPAKAKVLEANLEVHHGDDSTTFEATATYEYLYDDELYQGTRVGVHSGSDNIGSFHQDAAKKLQRLAESGESADIWVNPEDPSESVIYRELRWGSLAFLGLFSVLFGGVGLAMMVGGLVGTRRLQQEVGRKVRHPEESWRWKESWASGTLRSGSSVGGIAFFAIVWNLLSAPLAFFLPKEVFENGNSLAALGFLFPLIGLLLICSLIYTILQRIKYGVSELRLATVPAVLGSSFGGVLEVSRQLDPPDGFSTHLSCTRRLRSSGSKSSNRAEVLWEAHQVVRREERASGAARTAIPIYFELPEDGEPTTTEVTDNGLVQWRLKVSASVPGVDYDVGFDVPVFPSDTKVQGTAITRERVASYLEPLDEEAALERAGAVVRSTGPDRLSIVLGRGRNLRLAIGQTFGFLLWSGAIVLLVFFGAPLFLVTVFTLLWPLWAWVLVRAWLRRTEVSVDFAGVRHRSSVLFLTSEEERGTVEIRSVESRPSALKSGARQYYDVVLQAHSDEELKLLSALPSKAAADALARRIRHVLRLKDADDV